MSERELTQILQKLKSAPSYTSALPLLSTAKLTLLKLHSLTPLPTTPTSTLLLARETFELGALLSIRAKDPASFTRYKHLLTPFYELPSSRLPGTHSEKSKITGLYLLLLLTQGDYAGFHTELEGLGDAVHEGGDRFLDYPIKLERWLMEGSYDLVWRAMEEGRVPSEEYSVFSEVGLPVPSISHFPFPMPKPSLTGITNRSSPLKSAPKSPHAPKQPTPPSPSHPPKIFSSSTPRAPSYSSRRAGAG